MNSAPQGDSSSRVGDGEPAAMPDAYLTKFRARIKLTTGYGSTLEADFVSGKATPHKTLLAAIEELARFAAIAGLEYEARAASEKSFKAVAEWRLSKA